MRIKVLAVLCVFSMMAFGTGCTPTNSNVTTGNPTNGQGSEVVETQPPLDEATETPDQETEPPAETEAAGNPYTASEDEAYIQELKALPMDLTSIESATQGLLDENHDEISDKRMMAYLSYLSEVAYTQLAVDPVDAEGYALLETYEAEGDSYIRLNYAAARGLYGEYITSAMDTYLEMGADYYSETRLADGAVVMSWAELGNWVEQFYTFAKSNPEFVAIERSQHLLAPEDQHLLKTFIGGFVFDNTPFYGSDKKASDAYTEVLKNYSQTCKDSDLALIVDSAYQIWEGASFTYSEDVQAQLDALVQ